VASSKGSADIESLAPVANTVVRDRFKQLRDGVSSTISKRSSTLGCSFIEPDDVLGGQNGWISVKRLVAAKHRSSPTLGAE